jgi:adenosine deaminase
MLKAIEAGYEKAKKETGIEARFISTAVRHFGPAKALEAAQITRDNPHSLVTGFGVAGDENAHSFADFEPAFKLSGLPYRTAHAGEAAGPESVRSAKDVLKVRRFGHMVRAIEDKKLIDELKTHKAVPEVCVSSNLVLHVYKDYTANPLRKFFDAGLKVVLGSDDPSFFGTSIGREYQIARDHFKFTDDELRQITRNATPSKRLFSTKKRASNSSPSSIKRARPPLRLVLHHNIETIRKNLLLALFSYCSKIYGQSTYTRELYSQTFK